jgi:DNA-binding transcriptional LysR family regulator
MIAYSTHGGVTNWHYKHIASGQEGSALIRNPIFIANNAEMMLEAVQAGIGISVLPQFMLTHEIAKAKVQHILTEYATHPEHDVYAVFPQNRHLSTKIRVFVDFLSEYFEGFSMG